uniref:Integrase zinc-binding domain-containing protein n=1 Tax=Tanacetum cinerariifolium TaxID=118510 RepID=A0A6L2K6Y7_TANCI|nr:hypothetical protein [Tanacetum cinerariifolium]
MSMTIHSSIKARILEAQSEASKGINTLTEMLKGLDKQFERKEDGGLYLAKRIWVPVYGNLRTLIMNEAHATRYSIHPGADKMYYDLRGLYWWPRMKKDIAIYHSSVKCASFEALCGRRCRTPIAWEKVGESKLIVLEIIQETTNKIIQIKERLKTARDRQKSNADHLRKPLEFSVGKVLYVSKCLANIDLHVPLEEVKIDDKLHFVEEPMEIMDHEVKKLKKRRIPIVKVCWNSQQGPEFNWERKDEMKRKYS